MFSPAPAVCEYPERQYPRRDRLIAHLDQERFVAGGARGLEDDLHIQGERHQPLEQRSQNRPLLIGKGHDLLARGRNGRSSLGRKPLGKDFAEGLLGNNPLRGGMACSAVHFVILSDTINALKRREDPASAGPRIADTTIFSLSRSVR